MDFNFCYKRCIICLFLVYSGDYCALSMTLYHTNENIVGDIFSRMFYSEEFCDRHHNLMSVSQMNTDVFRFQWSNPVLSYFLTYHQIDSASTKKGPKKGPLVEQEFLNHPDQMSSTSFLVVVQSLVFCVVFYRLMFVFSFFFLWPLYCLSFDLRLLNHPFDIYKLFYLLCNHAVHVLAQLGFMTYHRVCNQSNMTGVTSGTGTVYTSWSPGFTPGFQLDCVARSLVCHFVPFLLAIVLS